MPSLLAGVEQRHTLTAFGINHMHSGLLMAVTAKAGPRQIAERRLAASGSGLDVFDGETLGCKLSRTLAILAVVTRPCGYHTSQSRRYALKRHRWQTRF